MSYYLPINKPNNFSSPHPDSAKFCDLRKMIETALLPVYTEIEIGSTNWCQAIHCHRSFAVKENFINIVAYCRVSTDKSDQINSLHAQEKFFTEYAKQSGDQLVKIYADVGISGTKIKKRKEFLKRIRDAETGMVDCYGQTRTENFRQSQTRISK